MLEAIKHAIVTARLLGVKQLRGGPISANPSGAQGPGGGGHRPDSDSRSPASAPAPLTP
ncbi:hypothetical protein [Streptomyces atratus]|uniref:hypothetical protein n=1 Tax=Streptomyces atratus TaxID=1893 RepID=UPI0037A28A8B